MDFTQLKYFIAVCRFHHMTQAADHLFISQSALSKHISQLEKEAGAPLFDRCGRTLHLTTAGQDFLAFAKDVVGRHDEVLLRIQNYLADAACCLSLGTIPVLAQYGIDAAIHAFQQQHPGFALNILEEKSDHILKLLDDEIIELAIVRTSSLPDASYKAIPLADDHILLVCSPAHPLASLPMVSLKDFEGEDFLLLDIGDVAHNCYLALCKAAGFTPHIRQQFTRIETILGFVRAGEGVSLLMEKDLAAFNTSQVCIKKLAETIPSTIALVFPHGRHLSPSAMLFRDFLGEYFG